jgi:biotin-(acetyl-CoA carboxylase) ligase
MPSVPYNPLSIAGHEIRWFQETIAKHVSVALAGGRIAQGTAIDVDSNGRLSVEGKPGIKAFTAGDIRIIRR